MPNIQYRKTTVHFNHTSISG